jgi:EAL domain-containing protein (putative c-di-GMP-specific phosphodiesterase class I)
MLKALKELADEFDLRLIAEGVEDEHQYNTIKDIGYKIIQGYYFSKPEDML